MTISPKSISLSLLALAAIGLSSPAFAEVTAAQVSACKTAASEDAALAGKDFRLDFKRSTARAITLEAANEAGEKAYVVTCRLRGGKVASVKVVPAK